MDKAEQLIGTALGVIKKFYEVNPEEQAPPMIILMKDEGVSEIMDLYFDNAFMKEMFIQAAHRYIGGKIDDVDASIFLSEAWMATAATKEEAVNMPPPSQNPDRVEVLIVEYSSKIDYLMITYKMIRDEVGHLVDLQEQARYDSASFVLDDNDDGEKKNRVSSRFDFFGPERIKLQNGK